MKPVFGNILEVPSPALNTQRESASARHVLESVTQLSSSESTSRFVRDRDLSSGDRDKGRDAAAAEVAELTQRIRILEAEARVAARERSDFDEEMQRAEENWAIELTALGIRNKSLELENNEMREEGRRAKIELAKLVSEIAALEACDSTRAMTLTHSKNQAERDAFGTLLAQQQLVKVLHSHKEASETQAALLRGELAALSAAHNAAMVECNQWKQRASAAEEELAVLRSAAVAAGEDDRAGPESDATAAEREERSTRRVLNREMERFLTLERSLATPILAQTALDSAWKYTARGGESLFGSYFAVASRSGALAAEKLALHQIASAATLPLPGHPTRYSAAVPQHWRTK
jgi:hypothetical protein